MIRILRPRCWPINRLLSPSDCPYNTDLVSGPCAEEQTDWARILAYITGTVDQELLSRNQYLVTENRILKRQLKGRLLAAAILSAPVTGHANGEEITLSSTQTMFRCLCRNALKGDNAALRRVIDLMLTLEPAAQQQAEQNANAGLDAKRKLMRMAGLDPDEIDDSPKEPSPEFEELNKRAKAMAKEERKRLIREVKHRQRMG